MSNTLHLAFTLCGDKACILGKQILAVEIVEIICREIHTVHGSVKQMEWQAAFHAFLAAARLYPTDQYNAISRGLATFDSVVIYSDLDPIDDLIARTPLPEYMRHNSQRWVTLKTMLMSLDVYWPGRWTAQRIAGENLVETRSIAHG
jgi:hypothetical protein